MQGLKTVFFIISSFLFLTSLTAQEHLFRGEWTRDGTTYIFEFELYLKHNGPKVTGYFDWTFAQPDTLNALEWDYYRGKGGLQAREYVQGKYEAESRTYYLVGYKKEDPHAIIGLDHYRLKVDENGDIGGDTKAHGSWQGRINGQGADDFFSWWSNTSSFL